VFEFWQCIDVFIYFAHALVAIPPVGWVDAAHTNGLPILGTFIAEWGEGALICAELFSRRDVAAAAARQLAAIAKWAGFDGWLVCLKAEPWIAMNRLLRPFSNLRNLEKQKYCTCEPQQLERYPARNVVAKQQRCHSSWDGSVNQSWRCCGKLVRAHSLFSWFADWEFADRDGNRALASPNQSLTRHTWH
jgi:endo-beta-N-acetylglucosaminidase D